MSNFAVTIRCRLNEDDTEDTLIILDTVKESSIQADSQVTSHPVAEGDIVADHMYKEPITLTLNGQISLSGNKGLGLLGENESLQNVQDIFEKIKDNGILCDIVKVQLVDKDDGTQIPQFKVRQSMVLRNITWTEKINTLSFSFSFVQVLIADINVEDIDPTDENLPEITTPNTLNFTDTLIDWNQINQVIDYCLNSFNLATAEFWNFLQSLTSTQIVAIIGGVVGAVVVAKVATLIGATAGPIGAAIGFGIGAIAILGAGIYNFFKKLNDRVKYRIEAFQYYEDTKKMDAEVARYGEFKAGVYGYMESLNSSLKAYKVSSNESQECLISIDDTYYDFLFTKNNTNQHYTLSLVDLYNDDKEVKNISDISGSPTNINECTDANAVYITPNKNVRIYLIRTGEDVTDLTNYYIFTSTFDMKEYTTKLEDLIKNMAILK